RDGSRLQAVPARDPDALQPGVRGSPPLTLVRNSPRALHHARGRSVQTILCAAMALVLLANKPSSVGGDMGQTAAELAVEGWFVAQAACQALGSFDAERECLFALGEDGRLRPLAGDGPEAVVRWQPSVGWCPAVGTDDPRRDLLDLYLP